MNYVLKIFFLGSFRSPKSSDSEASADQRARSIAAIAPPSTGTTTYLHVPNTTATHLIRQRSQPSPSSTGMAGNLLVPVGSSSSLSLGRSSATPPPHPAPTQSQLSFLAPSIPTLAVTPVSSGPNIVIEQYPTILRVVSIDDMNMTTTSTEFQASSSSVPALARTPSQSGKITLIALL